MKKRFFGGFTLVELMVAVAIIAILTAIITANFSTARAKSRDAKRISDISSIQLALAFYFDRCNVYPQDLSAATFTTACAGNGTTKLSDFLNALPTPPSPYGSDVSSGVGKYRYAIDSTATDYVLATQLENSSSSLTDDIDSLPSGISGITCTDTGSGAAANNYCIGPK